MAKLKDFRLQVFKFEMYGFLKNLRFFEPYLIIYLTVSGLTLFQVGLLISIREIIIYIFEIPSGVIADMYGKKVELIICFIFYIISFLLFFIAGGAFWIFALAMILFGLGEAFRSGTHKSMIMSFLDHNEIKASKTKVYGQTRAMSLIGSMVMSLIPIGLFFFIPELLNEIRWLFLLSIIPYVLDMILIASYPKYLNERREVSFNLKSFLKQNVESIKYTFKDRFVRRIVFDEALYQAGYKSIKDYVQPLIIALSVGAGLVAFTNYSQDENLKIYLGIIYAIIYLISSLASRYAYKVAKKANHFDLANIMWFMSAAIAIVLSFFLDNLFVIFGSFVLIYVFINLRKPVMVQEIGNASDTTKRASVLSIEAQLSSLLLVIFAPIIGALADYDMQLMFWVVGGIMMFIFLFNQLWNFKVLKKHQKELKENSPS
ncbi:MAG: MFS transporter [Candidatus Izemoplasmatales bacterium]|jgi:MFS family permease|nr:MFS transporter [Candidatus Izemoplasmatales bacterium]